MDAKIPGIIPHVRPFEFVQPFSFSQRRVSERIVANVF